MHLRHRVGWVVGGEAGWGPPSSAWVSYSPSLPPSFLSESECHISCALLPMLAQAHTAHTFIHTHGTRRLWPISSWGGDWLACTCGNHQPSALNRLQHSTSTCARSLLLRWSHHHSATQQPVCQTALQRRVCATGRIHRHSTFCVTLWSLRCHPCITVRGTPAAVLPVAMHANEAHAAARQPVMPDSPTITVLLLMLRCSFVVAILVAMSTQHSSISLDTADRHRDMTWPPRPSSPASLPPIYRHQPILTSQRVLRHNTLVLCLHTQLTVALSIICLSKTHSDLLDSSYPLTHSHSPTSPQPRSKVW